MSAQKCPVCLGKGTVPEGFYRQNLKGEWTSVHTGDEQCRSCGGRGIVFAPAPITPQFSSREGEQ